MTAVVAAWCGLFLGITGVGVVFAFVVKMLGSWGGGLR